MNELPPLDDLDLFVRLAVALASGMLIGLERGWEGRDLPEGSRIAGVRTFGLVGLLGGAVVLFAGDFSGVFLAAVALGLALFAAVAYWRASRIAADIGITTLVVLLLAFVLGALAGAGYLVPASAAAVVVAILLGIKPELHGILQRMDRTELLASLRLLLLSVVVLPVLPDQGYGPWQALNPYRIWWMVVLIAAISYAGYLSIRLIGTRRGILLTGLLGGLASSTAVTLSFARLAQRGAARPELLA
ncbi:MAG: MgtC/SapB family protein, partial [Minwuiales bacterium]|nr:MgtC/SapB family protein [Minwuiales bacterium]